MNEEEKRLARYNAHKKYAANNPEIYAKSSKKYASTRYRIHLIMAKDFKETVENLASEAGLSISQLFVSAVEEKYGVILHKDKQ